MMIIPLAPSLLTGSSSLPGDLGRAVRNISLFGLAPCGVLPAIRVATNAVRSYRTFSPLLASALRATAEQAQVQPASPKPEGRRRAVCFLCHFPSGHPDRPLAGALPCGVRTFLVRLRPCGLRRRDHLFLCGTSIIAAFSFQLSALSSQLSASRRL